MSTTWIVITLISVINIYVSYSSVKLNRDTREKLNDIEYKRWQIIHHHYVRDQIKNGEKELTMLHDFIRKNGGRV